MRLGGFKNEKLLLFVILLFLFSLGCINPIKPPEPLVLPSKPPIENIDPVVTVDWLADKLGATNLEVLHVGLDAEKPLFDRGHIPGSKFINSFWAMEDPTKKGMGGIVVSKEKFEKLMGDYGISNDDVVVLVGRPTDPWVARMFWNLKYYGHEKVAYLDGGLLEWVRIKGEGSLVRGAPKITPATYKATPNPNLRALGNYVYDNLNNPNVKILDVRPEGEYNGSKPLGNERGGHIPNAVRLEWASTNLNETNVTVKFRSKAELKALYEAAGITSDKEIIVYCEGGVRSAHTWMVLKYILGYPNVRNYDGSWNEWANSKNPDGSYKYPIIGRIVAKKD